MGDPFQIPSRETKLLHAIAALGLESFKARELPKRIPVALREYFGGRREISAIRIGILLKRILGEHDSLRLEGRYDEVQRLQLRGNYSKGLHSWTFRVRDTEAPTIRPGFFTPIARQKPEPALPPIVVKVHELAQSERADSATGEIHRETHSQSNPLNPFSASVEDMSKGIWERTGDSWQRVGVRMSDGAAQIGFPGGLKAALAAMERTAQLAGARREYRAMTHHQFMCRVLNCPEDSFS
jgi:hypothetical protein